MIPDFDAYTDDPETLAAPAETFAGSVADVQGGRRFVGGLFREDPLDEDADDADLEWLHGYTEDEPGSLTDVMNTFGPGLYRIRTAPGFPAATGRRITVQVGKRKPALIVAPNATPVVPPANVERMRREAAEEARAEIEHEKDMLSREVRRMKLEVADTEDIVSRARREADRLSGECVTLRQHLATAQDEAVRARTALAEASMRHATEAATAAREAADEIDGYRAEASELRAENQILDYQLAAALRGEDVSAANTDSLWARGLDMAGPLIERFAAGTPTAPAAPQPTAMIPPPLMPLDVPHYDLPAEPTLSPFDTPSAFSGDGHAGTPAEPFTPGDGSAQNARSRFSERPEAADVAVFDVGADAGADPFVAVAAAARAVLQGVAPVPPAEFRRLVERAQADGVTADDFRGLAAHLAAEAVQAQPAVDAIAAFLAPLAVPFAGALRGMLALPASTAVSAVFASVGVPVPAGKPAKAYLGRVLTALKPLL